MEVLFLENHSMISASTHFIPKFFQTPTEIKERKLNKSILIQ